MTCSICHKEFMSNAECEAGHFVCDGCHRGDLSMIEASCLASTSLDPSVILTDLMERQMAIEGTLEMANLVDGVAVVKEAVPA